MTDQVENDLLFTEMNLGTYLTKHYALWFDLRTTDNNSLLNVSEGITIQITKKQETDKTLNICLYIIQDAQISFEEERLKEVLF